MSRTGFGSALAIISLLLSSLATPSPAQDSPAAAIFADWAKRQTAYNSLRIQTEGTVRFTPELLNQSEDAAQVNESITKPESFTLLIDCETGRARLDLKTSMPAGTGPRVQQFNRSFVIQKDQAIVKFQRAENTIAGDDSISDRPDLSVMPLESGVFPTHDVMPILWSLGRVSLPNRELRGRKFWEGIEYDAALFDSIVTESPTLVRLKSKPSNPRDGGIYSELTLNPKLQYAITRMTLFGSLKQDVQIKYDNPEHPLLPSEWSYSFLHGSKVWRAHQQKVISIEINPPVTDKDFDFPLEPGRLISRDGRKFRVSQDGSMVDLDQLEVESRRQSQLGKFIFRNPTLIIVAGMSISAMLIVTGIISARRRRTLS